MRYYFSKLDKEGREIYKKLYFGMQNFEKKISLKGTENIVREIYYMIIKDNPMISRRHARIYQINCEFWLEDLKSLNHTFVNDKVISEPVKLIPGMKFRLSLDEEFEVIEIMEN